MLLRLRLMSIERMHAKGEVDEAAYQMLTAVCRAHLLKAQRAGVVINSILTSDQAHIVKVLCVLPGWRYVTHFIVRDDDECKQVYGIYDRGNFARSMHRFTFHRVNNLTGTKS